MANVSALVSTLTPMEARKLRYPNWHLIRETMRWTSSRNLIQSAAAPPIQGPSLITLLPSKWTNFDRASLAARWFEILFGTALRIEGGSGSPAGRTPAHDSTAVQEMTS